MKTYIKLCSVATGILLLSACGSESSNNSVSKPKDKAISCTDTQFISADGKSCLSPMVTDIAQEYVNVDNDDKTLRFTIVGENLAALDIAINDCESGKVISKTDKTVVYECTPKQAGDSILIFSKDNKKIYSKNLTIKEKEVKQPVSKLTATGMTTCGNDLKNGLDCETGLTGEWKDLQQDGLVQAGQPMSYQELLVNGETCIQDKVTGLVWEKKNSSGWRSKDHTYSWYNTDAKTNGGAEGYENKGECDASANGTLCDTQNYIAALNKQKYCGYSDWRLPNINELYSIADYNRIPSISDIFDDVQQNQQPEQIWWSSTPDNDEEGSNYAWVINYYDASSASKPNGRGYSIRAVRADNNK